MLRRDLRRTVDRGKAVLDRQWPGRWADLDPTRIDLTTTCNPLLLDITAAQEEPNLWLPSVAPE